MDNAPSTAIVLRALHFGMAFLCLSLAGEARTATEFGAYRSLVIGVNAYRHITALETAVHDATTVHAVLQRDYGFESELVIDPDRYTLVRKLDALRAETLPDDNLVIYFAGHGFLDRETGEGYWLPADAEQDSQANWVPVSTITRTLRAMAAKHVLVIADSCYSGTLTRDAPVRLETGADRIEELRRLSRKRARKALTSGGLEPVVDGGRNGHSVFTGTLLDVLRDAAEPLDGFSLYTKLRRGVIVNADQTPSYGDIRLSGDEGGDFILVPVAARLAPAPQTRPAAPDTGITRAPETATELDLELAFWQSVQSSEHAADYEAYLAQFPDGAFAALARSRVELLSGTSVVAGGPRYAPGVDPIEVEPLSGPYVALSQTNVRTGPTSDSPLVKTLTAGSRLTVSGKVPQRNWVQISEEGQAIGYAYAVGLRPAAAVEADEQQARAEQAARQAAQQEAERRAAAQAQQTRAEQEAAFQRYQNAQNRKDALELERERIRRGHIYPYVYRYRKYRH